MDRGPLARKRDVAFIYHTNKMNELQQQAAELEVGAPVCLFVHMRVRSRNGAGAGVGLQLARCLPTQHAAHA